MLSRIIRHPAGFVKRAWSRNFLSVPFARPGHAAPRPEYWLVRFSGVGLSLAAPGGPAAPATSPRQPSAQDPGFPAPSASPAPAIGGNGADVALPRQGGKAASFLLAGTQRSDRP